MKVLIVASDKGNHFVPFIEEQMAALAQAGIETERFGIRRKGLFGYLRELPRLCRTIQKVQPDIVHAHYGLSGLLAGPAAQICKFTHLHIYKLPVVVTYHGSDINDPKVLRLSCLAMRLSAWNIFVSKRNVATATRACSIRHYSLIPCGVNLTDDQLQTRSEARQRLTDSHMQCTVSDGHTRRQCAFSEIQDAPIVLFAGALDNPVKDSRLAEQIIQSLGTPNAVLVELRGYDRGAVNSLMCAADCLLLTSKCEGSPQVIKEAMACGCPIVSVDVGDVAERMEGIEGCYVANTRDPHEIASLVEQAVTLSLSLSLSLSLRTQRLRAKPIRVALKHAGVYKPWHSPIRKWHEPCRLSMPLLSSGRVVFFIFTFIRISIPLSEGSRDACFLCL